jgi:hypothetical protein
MNSVLSEFRIIGSNSDGAPSSWIAVTLPVLPLTTSTSSGALDADD